MRTRVCVRILAILVALALALAQAACKPKGTPAPTAPPERPHVTPAPEKIAPPDASRFTGYSLRLTPARGPTVILQEPVGAELILDADATERLQIPNAVGRFGNTLEVLDADGNAKYRFTLASDGQLVAKSEDGRAFRMPEYIYYLLEEQLWSYDGSLIDSALKWDPAKGTAQLELELPRLLKTAMLPAFGFASAYFATYTIYGVNTDTRDVAKVYVLLTYAGYGVKGELFSPDFLYTTPATLIFKKIGGQWKLTDLKQPGKAEDSKDQYNKIRVIFPYEHMEAVLDDLKKLKELEDASPQVKDIIRQVSEYLNDVGIAGLTVKG